MLSYLEIGILILQVYCAIEQAVQRAPNSPESHNLHGLVCESRTDYQSAIFSYQQARCLLKIIPNSKSDIQSGFIDITFNLARSLCKVRFIAMLNFCCSYSMTHLCPNKDLWNII